MIQNKIAAFIIIICLSSSVISQNNTSSSYSRFGIGILESKADVRSAGMGYSGLALSSNQYLNNLNPASYSALDSARFLFNIQGKMSFSNYVTNTDEQTNFDANIESIGFGFKAGKNWGMGFSLSPYSSIGYSVNGDKYILGTLEKYPVKYYGEGGLSQLSWYNGIKLFKGLSMGLNASYLWGSTDIIEVSYYPTIIGETIYNERNYHVSTLLFEYGFQYKMNIGQNSLSLGGTANISTELDTYFEHRIYNNMTSDLSSKTEDSDNIFIPVQYQGGLAFQTHKGWTLAADYRFGQWSNSEIGISKGSIRDTHGGSIGIEYTAPRFHRELYKRIQYRLGAFFNQQYLTIQGQNIDTKGITAGLTIPMRDGSRINLAYEYQLTGTTNIGLVEETYNSIRLGITFNEKWFQKREFK